MRNLAEGGGGGGGKRSFCCNDPLLGQHALRVFPTWWMDPFKVVTYQVGGGGERTKWSANSRRITCPLWYQKKNSGCPTACETTQDKLTGLPSCTWISGPPKIEVVGSANIEQNKTIFYFLLKKGNEIIIWTMADCVRSCLFGTRKV